VIKTLKRIFWLGSSIGSLGLLAYGLYLGYNELSKHPSTIDYRYLPPSIAAYSASLIVLVVNWNSILQSLGVSAGFRRNMKLYCFSNLSKQLPSMLWFVGTRVLIYEREGVAKAITSAAILLELALVAFSNVVVCVAVIPALPALQNAQRVLLVLVVPPLLFIVVRPQVAIRLMNRLLVRLGRNPLVIPLGWRNMLRWSMLYAFTWGVGGLFLYLLALAVYPAAVRYPLEITAAWVLSGLASQLRAILPIGIGWREVTLAYLLSLFMPLPSAVVIAILSKIWLAVNQSLWFLVSLLL
jgi:hypothetical protein